VNKGQRQVLFNSEDRQGVALSYDSLIIATGAQHSYFGHDEFERYAPGLKSLADAVGVRNKILKAFEQAEAEEDPNRHRDLLTFVLVGGGPTGVEMAAAIATLVRTSLRADFRRIDPTTARIILVDRSKRVLNSFSENLSEAALSRLKTLGAEVFFGARRRSD
jgi:NADH:ubiquinone reductase (H+-translocating)